MAKSLDPSNISVVSALGSGVYSPFDCNKGPLDSGPGADFDNKDDDDFVGFDC